MEGHEQERKDDMKVEIPSAEQTENICAGLTTQLSLSMTKNNCLCSPNTLTRQLSMTKNNCLCSPTTHAGSFRCRLHRSPSLQRTKSLNYAPHPDPTSSKPV